MDKNQLLELLDKYAQGTCTPEEIALLNQFYDSFQEEAPGDQDALETYLRQESIRKEVKRRIAEKDNQRYLHRRETAARRGAWLRYAAVALLVIGVGIGSYIGQQPAPAPEVAWTAKSTRPGQKATVTLTDGTQVYLNVDSKLSYPEHFAADQREVILEGEAFFEVSRNPRRPFIIRSGDLTTTVLGTSFNIKAFKDEPLHVTVATGKVQVGVTGADTAGHSVVLLPLQQAYYDGQLSKKEAVDLSRFTAWREKVLHFEESRLSEVVAVLERWFDVSITIENEQLGECTITGKYINENLMNVMESLEHILGIEYRVLSEREMVISGTKCNAATQPSYE